MSRRPRAPAGIDGRRWRAAWAEWHNEDEDLDADPALLEQLLRLEDRLRQVRAAIDDQGVTVRGSTGQLRAHPLLLVERQLARDLALLRRAGVWA